MSIAVLRTFIAKRKEEHAARLSKKVKEHKVPGATTSDNVAEGPVAQDKAASGDCDILPDHSMDDEPDNTNKPVKVDEADNTNEPVTSSKGQKELKAPKILEVHDHIPQNTNTRARVHTCFVFYF